MRGLILKVFFICSSGRGRYSAQDELRTAPSGGRFCCLFTAEKSAIKI
nr:MAG TPA: hypothetical protein [Caudoviricetes sp.]